METSYQAQLNIPHKKSKKKNKEKDKHNGKLYKSTTKNQLHEDDFYRNLTTKGPYVPADTSELETVYDIPWFDKSLMKESVVFHEKYFGQETISLMAALFFGFAVKPNSAVLLRTGRLHDQQVSFHRYLSTSHRIQKFFNFDWNSKQQYAEFRTVRKMHVLASRKSYKSHPTPEDLKLNEPWKTAMVDAMHKDLEFLDPYFSDKNLSQLLTWNPPVPVSQFDLATTQLGLWGTMWLFAKVFGISDRNKEMKGVIHSWAVFGRLLGMKDEFNICLQNDPVLYEKMFKEIVLFSLRTIDPTVVTIQAAFIESFTKRFPLVSYKSVMYLGLRLWGEGYEGKNLWKIMTWWDKICMRVLQFTIWASRNITFIRIVLNFSIKLWFQFNFWVYLPSKKH